MNTTQENTKFTAYVYDSAQLEKLMLSALNDIEKLIEKENFHISDDSKESLKQMKKVNWKSIFNSGSQRNKKRFNKYLLKFRKRQTRHSANLFLHFINKNLLILNGTKKVEREVKNAMFPRFAKNEFFKRIFTVPTIDKVNIKPSLKEQAIQSKRKAWLKSRAEAEKLMLEYKEEKGDYYMEKG